MFVQYFRRYSVNFGVCSTSGDSMSTSEDVHYIGGYHGAYGRYPEYTEGYHEYIGGYHAHIRGYHDACGGVS